METASKLDILKHGFNSLLSQADYISMSDFMNWLDLKLSEYKQSGHLHEHKPASLSPYQLPIFSRALPIIGKPNLTSTFPSASSPCTSSIPPLSATPRRTPHPPPAALRPSPYSSPTVSDQVTPLNYCRPTPTTSATYDSPTDLRRPKDDPVISPPGIVKMEVCKPDTSSTPTQPPPAQTADSSEEDMTSFNPLVIDLPPQHSHSSSPASSSSSSSSFPSPSEAPRQRVRNRKSTPSCLDQLRHNSATITSTTAKPTMKQSRDNVQDNDDVSPLVMTSAATDLTTPSSAPPLATPPTPHTYPECASQAPTTKRKRPQQTSDGAVASKTFTENAPTMQQTPKNKVTPVGADCPHCGKHLRYRSSFCRHMRIHAGVFTHECSTCERKFTRREHFQRHNCKRKSIKSCLAPSTSTSATPTSVTPTSVTSTTSVSRPPPVVDVKPWPIGGELHAKSSSGAISCGDSSCSDTLSSHGDGSVTSCTSSQAATSSSLSTSGSTSSGGGGGGGKSRRKKVAPQRLVVVGVDANTVGLRGNQFHDDPIDDYNEDSDDDDDDLANDYCSGNSAAMSSTNSAGTPASIPCSSSTVFSSAVGSVSSSSSSSMTFAPVRGFPATSSSAAAQPVASPLALSQGHAMTSTQLPLGRANVPDFGSLVHMYQNQLNQLMSAGLQLGQVAPPPQAPPTQAVPPATSSGQQTNPPGDYTSSELPNVKAEDLSKQSAFTPPSQALQYKSDIKMEGVNNINQGDIKMEGVKDINQASNQSDEHKFDIVKNTVDKLKLETGDYTVSHGEEQAFIKVVKQGNYLKLRREAHLIGDKVCFVCPHCQKIFHRSSNFSRHMRIHRGVYSYVCPNCQRGFFRKEHFQKHKCYRKGMSITYDRKTKMSQLEGTVQPIKMST